MTQSGCFDLPPGKHLGRRTGFMRRGSSGVTDIPRYWLGWTIPSASGLMSGSSLPSLAPKVVRLASRAGIAPSALMVLNNWRPKSAEIVVPASDNQS
jgi:hypothetical protein